MSGGFGAILILVASTGVALLVPWIAGSNNASSRSATSPEPACVQAVVAPVTLSSEQRAVLRTQAKPLDAMVRALRHLGRNDPTLAPVVESHVVALSRALDAHMEMRAHLFIQWELGRDRPVLRRLNQTSWNRVQDQVRALTELHWSETRRLMDSDPGREASIEARAKRSARAEIG
jgi:hypothetical protein